MKKVIILKGLPASGKSTYAKKLIDDNPGMYKRVNKDDLRAMLDNSKWSRDNEKFILKIRDEIILQSLSSGKHVIVDDTNLAPKHESRIREIVKGKATVEIVGFLGVSPEECIKRDLKRANSVGHDVIMGMYTQFIRVKGVAVEQDQSLPKGIIFDVDGTLAHMVDRKPYDWGKVGQDTPDSVLIPTLQLYKDAGYKIIVFTGRDGVCEEETKEWLKKHDVEFDHFDIRPEGNTEKDSIIKRRMFDKIKGKYNVCAVYDDRDQVVKMWRELGIPCYQVAYGNF